MKKKTEAGSDSKYSKNHIDKFSWIDEIKNEKISSRSKSINPLVDKVLSDNEISIEPIKKQDSSKIVNRFFSKIKDLKISEILKTITPKQSELIDRTEKIKEVKKSKIKPSKKTKRSPYLINIKSSPILQRAKKLPIKQALALVVVFVLISATLPLILPEIYGNPGEGVKISLEPNNVYVDDVMIINATIPTYYNITSVTADFEGFDQINLELIDESETEQKWTASWVVPNMSSGEYFTDINAYDKDNLSYSATLEWWIAEEIIEIVTKDPNKNKTEEPLDNDSTDIDENKTEVTNFLEISIMTDKESYFLNDTVQIQGKVLLNDLFINNSVKLIIENSIYNQSVDLNVTYGEFSYEFTPKIIGDYNIEALVSYENISAKESMIIIIQSFPPKNKTDANAIDLVVWDDTDYLEKYVDESVTFYTNCYRGGASIENAICYISFNIRDWSDPIEMDNKNGVYSYSKTFKKSGKYEFNVTCYVPGYENISLINDFKILRPKIGFETVSNVEIGKDVLWSQSFYAEEGLTFNVSKYAYNISIVGIDSEKDIIVITEGKNKSLNEYNKNKQRERIVKDNLNYQDSFVIDSNDIPQQDSDEYDVQLVILNESDYVEISYFTSGPKIYEESLGEKGKRVIVSSDVHYNDIFTYVSIVESQKEHVKLYWLDDGTYKLVRNATLIDTNNNNLFDRIEWITPSLSNQTYQIVITKAEHLDENRSFISDIYDEVYQLDNIWSETIPTWHYIRVTFEIPLDNTRDITLYPRIVSGTPRIEIYEVDGNEIIAEFESLVSYAYNKVYLTGLNGSQDTFDLRVLDGSIEIDHIIDPSQYARPNADLYNDPLKPWVTTEATRYEAINETFADGSLSEIHTENNQVTAYVAGLQSVTDPTVHTGHTIRVQAHEDGADMTLEVQLRQGYVDETTQGTLIATTGALALTTSYALYEYNLTEGEAENISDYTNLSFRFVPADLGAKQVYVTWAELEVPAAYTPDAPSSFTATANGRFQIDLSWTDHGYADTTLVEWNSAEDPTWDPGDHTELYNGTDESTSHTSLDPDTTYYYKAWSWNDTDNVWSTGSTDNTTTNAHNPPSLHDENPANGSSNQDLSLTWNITIDDADGDTFNWWINCSNGQTNSSTGDSDGSKELSITGLTYDTEYTVWANATDSYNQWNYTWYNFTTRSIYTPLAPGSFTAVADGRFEIDLSWDADPNNKTLVRYAAGGTPPASTTEGTELYNDTGASTSLTSLQPSSQYSFAAWTWNITDSVYSASSSTDTATTDSNIPTDHGTPSPANGSENQPVILTWSIEITDKESDTFNWTIECSNGQNNSANNENNGTKQLSLSGLSYLTEYKVWVNSTDDYDWNRTWYNFTTRAAYTPDAPSSFTATANGRFQIDLSWTDHGYSDTTLVEWNSAEDLSWDPGDHTDLYNGTGESTSHTSLDPGTTYYYKAWSWNGTDNVWSTGSTNNSTTDSNNAPIISFEFPSNSSTGISLTPVLNVTVDDSDGDILTVKWYENTTEVFVLRNTNNSVSTGSNVSYTFTEFDSFCTTYWWKVTANDSYNGWDNETFYFTTIENMSTSVDTISPYLQTVSPLTINATESAEGTPEDVTLYYRWSDDNVSWETGGLHGINWTVWNNDSNPDTASPWSWDFDFPNGTGYYEFYSIGKKSGISDETAPASADAICNYTVGTISISLSHESWDIGETWIEDPNPYQTTGDYFTLTNDGTVTVDVTLNATNATNSSANAKWAISETTGHDQFKLEYQIGAGEWTNINETYGSFTNSLITSETFDLRIYMATSSSTQDELSFTITFKAVAS